MFTLTDTEKQKGRLRCADELFLHCFIAYAVSYVGRNNYSTCMESMIGDGLFGEVFAGLISTAYFALYGIGQLLCGFLARRFSPRYMIGLGLFGVGVFNILMGVNKIPILFVVIWGLNGICNSMLWTPVIRIFAEWLPRERKDRAGLYISMSIPCGTIMSYLIPSIIFKISNNAWEAVFLFSGIMLIFFSLIWFLGLYKLAPFVREMSSEFESEMIDETRGDRYSFISVFFKTCLPIVAVVAISMGALKEAITTWIPKLLTDFYGKSSSTAALISVLLPIVCAAGAFVAKALDRKYFKNEIKTCAALFTFGFFVSLIATILVFIGGKSAATVGAVVVTVLLSMLISSTWGVNTMILTFVPYRYAKTRLSPTVTGTLNCISFFSASLFSFVYGSVKESFGWEATFILWLALALFASVFSLAFAKTWKKGVERA